MRAKECPEVGEMLRTPFGDVAVLKIDHTTDWIHTSVGIWGMSEMTKVQVFEGDDLIAFLSSPDFEVHSTEDSITESCICSCRGCHGHFLVHKLTGKRRWTEHLAGFSCSCRENSCFCLGSRP